MTRSEGGRYRVAVANVTSVTRLAPGKEAGHSTSRVRQTEGKPKAIGVKSSNGYSPTGRVAACADCYREGDRTLHPVESLHLIKRLHVLLGDRHYRECLTEGRR